MRITRVLLIFIVFAALVGAPVFAAGGGKNGTTLAAVKTLDICDAGDGNWL